MEQNLEIDTIKHLLEVEKNAATLIDDAKKEAEKRLLEARSKYNSEYKIRYDSMASELEKDYQEKLKKITAEYTKEIETYKTSLENTPQNQKNFYAFLEKHL